MSRKFGTLYSTAYGPTVDKIKADNIVNVRDADITRVYVHTESKEAEQAALNFLQTQRIVCHGATIGPVNEQDVIAAGANSIILALNVPVNCTRVFTKPYDVYVLYDKLIRQLCTKLYQHVGENKLRIAYIKTKDVPK